MEFSLEVKVNSKIQLYCFSVRDTIIILLNFSNSKVICHILIVSRRMRDINSK
jgi:hypothetical protein